MLVVSFYMAAENSCEFTRGEFTTGMKELEADSLSKLKGQIPALRRQLKDPSKFQVADTCFDTSFLAIFTSRLERWDALCRCPEEVEVAWAMKGHLTRYL